MIGARTETARYALHEIIRMRTDADYLLCQTQGSLWAASCYILAPEPNRFKNHHLDTKYLPVIYCHVLHLVREDDIGQAF